MTIAVISMIRDAWGGSEELWYEMAKEALKDGHKVVHLAFEHPIKHPKIEELESLGMQRIARPGWVPNTSPAGRFMHLGWNYLRKKVADPFKKVLANQPDVILYNGTCYSIAAEKGLLKTLLQPAYQHMPFYIIGHLNNDGIRDIDNAQAAVIKQAYGRCKKVFFVSQRNIYTAERHLCAEIPNAEIIRNPVNLSSTEAIPFPEKKGTISFAMVGNLVTAHKGQDLMLQALSKWKETAWTLNIYGNGMDLSYLKALTTHLQLQQKVFFHGNVGNIREVWEQNQVLLMPSHMEGMPLAIVEAMLCGRVCIATDVGGINEWITDGETGFIAAAPTVALLLQALETAWDKKQQWPEIGNAAHQAAIKRYDPQAGKNLLRRIIAP